MKRGTLISVLCMSLLTPSAALAGQEPGGSSANFRTPGGAAYCGYNEASARYACWTPNDGFEVYMRHGHARKLYDPYLRAFSPNAHMLRFGWTRAWPPTSYGMRCTSRRSGLTCKNHSGHGWWLGRYVGYRLF
jgi:hypothetical protein